jgi:hypothetical protein
MIRSVRERVALAGISEVLVMLDHRTTGNACFANSAKLLAKTPTQLAKPFPTGFSSSCWERTVPVGKEPLAF